jgi:hypothetical protein
MRLLLEQGAQKEGVKTNRHVMRALEPEWNEATKLEVFKLLDEWK